MKGLRTSLFIPLSGTVLTVAAWAQTSAPMPPAAAATGAPSDVNLRPEGAVQRIGSDDLLAVAVSDLPELNRNFRVSADGTLALPMLSERIPVSGKFTPEVEKEISEALVNEQILVRPVVAVSIAECRSAPVNVLGSTS